MKDELKTLQKRISDTLAPVLALQRIQPTSPKAPEQAEALLAKWPDAPAVVQLLADAAEQLREMTARVRSNRESDFRRIESEFIRSQRDSGRSIREKDSAWRIDHVELEMKRASGQARVSYNLEPLTEWQAVASAQDLQRLLDMGQKKLQSATIEDSRLKKAIEDAFLQAEASTKKDMILIQDLYREFRVALVREELRGSKPDRRLQTGDMPRWAFLWNLDIYRDLTAGTGLRFEPGSQSETTKGLGVTLGGRTPDRDYRTFCYVKRAAQ